MKKRYIIEKGAPQAVIQEVSETYYVFLHDKGSSYEVYEFDSLYKAVAYAQEASERYEEIYLARRCQKNDLP